MEDKIDFNTNTLGQFLTFSQNMMKLFTDLNIKIQLKSSKEQHMLIRKEMKDNSTFNSLKVNLKLFEKLDEFKQQCEKLNNIVEGRDEQINLNTQKDIKPEVESTGMITIDNKSTSKSSSQSNKEIKSNSIQKIEKLLSGVASELDFSNEKELLILEKTNYIPMKYISSGSFGYVYKVLSKTDTKEYA